MAAKIKSKFLSPRRSSRGFTMVEAMVVMTILSVLAVGAGVGLQALARVPDKNDDALVISNELVDKMEEVKALPFATLQANNIAATSVTVSGQTYSRTVSVTAFNPGTGAMPTDFLQITVSLAGKSLTCYVVKP